MIDLANAAVVEGMQKLLVAHIREELRTRIMAAVQADIDAAVDGAIQALEAEVATMQDQANMHLVVKVLLADGNGDRG